MTVKYAEVTDELNKLFQSLIPDEKNEAFVSELLISPRQPFIYISWCSFDKAFYLERKELLDEKIVVARALEALKDVGKKVNSRIEKLEEFLEND